MGSGLPVSQRAAVFSAGSVHISVAGKDKRKPPEYAMTREASSWKTYINQINTAPGDVLLYTFARQDFITQCLPLAQKACPYLPFPALAALLSL